MSTTIVKRKAETENNGKSKRQRELLSNESVQRLVKLIRQAEETSRNSGHCQLSQMKVSIAMTGNTSSGKTTLVKTILRCSGLPSSEFPCTGYNIRVQAVDPSEIPNKYQLTLPEKKKSFFGSSQPLLNTDEPNEISRRLGEEFAPLMKEGNKRPDFSKFATLKVQQPDAPQICLIDTPGFLLGNTIDEWTNAITKIDGSDNPLIVVSVKYDNIMTEGALGMICAQKARLVNTQLIIVITHMDLYVQKKSDQATEYLKSTIQKFFSDFKGLIKKVALVQAVDPVLARNNANESTIVDDYDKHREAEMITLEHIPEEIRNMNNVLVGIDNLTDSLIRFYISRYSNSDLRLAQKTIGDQIVSLESTIIQKKSEVIPSSQSATILMALMKNSPVIGDIEHEYRHSIAQYIDDLLCGMKIPEPKTKQNSGWFTIFGPTKTDMAVEDQSEARRIAKEIIFHIASKSQEIVHNAMQHYANFVANQVEHYKKICPRLNDEIIVKWEDFVKNAETSASMEILRLTKMLGGVMNFKLAQSPVSNNLCGTKLEALKKTNTIASTVYEILCVVLDGINLNVMGVMNEHVFVKFPDMLNTYLSNIQGNWKCATDEEIKTLESQLEPLKKTDEMMTEIAKMCSI